MVQRWKRHFFMLSLFSIHRAGSYIQSGAGKQAGRLTGRMEAGWYVDW